MDTGSTEFDSHLKRDQSLSWTLCAVFAALPFATSAGLFSKFVISKYLHSQTLDEFRVGSLALTGLTKTGEFFIPFVLFGIIVTVSVFVFSRSKSGLLTETDQIFLSTSAILAMPAIVPFILGNGGPIYPFADSAFLLVLVMQLPCALFFFVRMRFENVHRNPVAIESTYLLRLWLLAATPISFMGFLVALRYFVTPMPTRSLLWIGIGFIFVALLVTVIAGVIPKIILEPFNIGNLGFSLLGILGLPLLLPPLLNSVGKSEVVPGFNTNAWKVLLVISTLMILIEALIRRFRANRILSTSGIPSFAIAALLVPLRGVYGVPSISSDDYHFGETFSPEFLFRKFNQIPYTEIVLPRGLLANVVPGIVNNVLFNGSASTSTFVFLVIAFFVVGISHLLLRAVVGVSAATIMVGFVAVANTYLENDLLVSALLLFTVGIILQRPRALILGPSMALSISVAVLAYPLMGVAMFAVVIFIFIASVLGELFGRHHDSKYLMTSIFTFACTILLIYISPIGQPLIDAFKYVLINAGSNTESFGVSIDLTLGTPFALGQILSMSFMLGIFASFWIFWIKRKSLFSHSWHSYSSLMLAITPALFSLAFFGRYLGRIDPSVWIYRSAAGSIVVIGIISPAVLLSIDKKEFTKASYLFFALAAVISLSIAPIGRGGLISNSIKQVEAPNSWSTETVVESIPTLGLGNSDSNHIASLIEIKGIAADLEEGEPVLNLSNRGALFKYMNWRNPLGYLAPYNIPSGAEELVIINRLKKYPPLIAFLGPGNQHDGLSLTLRNPLLAKWVMSNYNPIQCGSTAWAVLDSELTSNQIPKLNCLQTEAEKTLPYTQIWASSIGAPTDLMKIPSSWGSRATQTVFDSTKIYTYTGTRTNETQSFTLVVSRSELDPQPQLLQLSVSCPVENSRPLNSPDISAEITWGFHETSEPHSSSTFAWGVGSFLIPMDAYPTWTSDLSTTKFIRLKTSMTDCQSGWKVVAQMRSR